MPTANAGDGDELPPAFLERYERVRSEMEAWADEVIGAWLERQHRRFAWRRDDFRYDLSLDVEGRSVYDGDCVLTRAKDWFIAIVSGRRYRSLNSRTQLTLLQGALTRRGVVGYVVPPPFVCGWISEEMLDRWYHVAKEWDALTPAEVAARYAAIAATFVDAFLGTREPETYRDGYYLAQATAESIYVGPECIVAHPARDSRIALVSARRYPVTSFRSLLRMAVRFELEHRGVPMRDIRPTWHSYTSQWDLLDAWQKGALRLST